MYEFFFKIEEFEVKIFHIFLIQGLSDDLTRYTVLQQLQFLFEGLNTFQPTSPHFSPHSNGFLQHCMMPSTALCYDDCVSFL